MLFETRVFSFEIFTLKKKSIVLLSSKIKARKRQKGFYNGITPLYIRPNSTPIICIHNIIYIILILLVSVKHCGYIMSAF